MSKSPVLAEVDGSLMHLIETSLVVQCLAAGSNSAVIRPGVQQYPYTLIGQNTRRAIVVRPVRGKAVRIEPGGGYILPEGQQLHMGAVDDQPQMYHWSHMRFRIFGNLDLFDIVQSPYGVEPREGKWIGQINRELAQLHQHTGAEMLQQIARRKLASARMLTLVLEQCPVVPGAMQKLALLSRFKRVFEFIDDNLDRPVFRDELSSIVNLSPSRFHASFLEATGLSPMAYVTQLRLRKAQERLLGSGDAVHVIAQAVGFRDPFHFSRTFSRHLGISPSVYRQRARASLLDAGN